MALTMPIFNNKQLQLSNDTQEEIKLLDIYQFVNRFDYPIEKLYIDRFWNSIQNNDWIVVDYETLRWMGYASARDIDNKMKYKKLLEYNFVSPDDYDMVSKGDTRASALGVTNKNTIIVRARRFKESLMILQTQQARDIRRYYITLEDIMIDYMRYTKFVSDHNNAVDNTKLRYQFEEYKQATDDKIAELMKAVQQTGKIPFSMNTNKIKPTEYVYVLTSKRYYNNGMFKIGKTTNLKNRLGGYNTGAALGDDEMFYICAIQCFDCAGLEKILHKSLAAFHHSKEWFHVPHKVLFEVIKIVIQQQRQLCDIINTEMSKLSDIKTIDYTKDQYLEISEFASISDVITSTPQIQSEKPNMECRKCGKFYKLKSAYERHVLSCVCAKCPACECVFQDESIANAHKCQSISVSSSDSIETTSEESSPSEDLPTREIDPVGSVVELKRDGFKWRCSGCSKKFLSHTNGRKHLSKCDG
jgi:MSV199 domain/T5orf172 domain